MQSETIIVNRVEKPSIENQRILKNLLISQIACCLNVPSGVALKICRRLHFEFSTSLKSREDCSFQVLNAYDLYYEFMYLLWVSDD